MQVIWKQKALKQLKKIGNKALSQRFFDAALMLIGHIEEVKKRDERTY